MKPAEPQGLAATSPGTDQSLAPASQPVPHEDIDLEGPAPEIDFQADDAVISRAFQMSVLVLVMLALIVSVGLWLWTRGPAALPNVGFKNEPPAQRVNTGIPIPTMIFADATRMAGIDYIHESGAMGEKLLPESMGGGCAFFDYNNDEHPDILFVNSDYWPSSTPSDRPRPTMALYRNDGQGNFSDVTAEAGLAVSFYGQGVAVGDYDNDGWVDVFISAVGQNRLFHNDRGRFTDVTAAAGVAGGEQEWSTSCGFFDYDNDQDLDLYVCNYVRWSPEIDRDLKCSLLGGELRAYCRPDAFQGSFPYLYRNEGGGRFTDVSAESGVQVENPSTEVPAAKSLGIVPFDVDGDGWLDLIIANDTVQNFLLYNRRDGTFIEVGADKAIAFDNTGNARGAMGIDAGFPRNDDTLAVVIGNFSLEPTALYCAQRRPIDELLFSDDAVAAGIGPPSRNWLKFGVFFFDADLDGRLDVLVANGHLENDIDKVQKNQRYAQPPQLFWNAGPAASTEFLPAAQAQIGSDFAQPLVGRGAAYADIDGDGDLDVLITATGGAPRLLRNDQRLGNHWLRLKLVGRRCNRDAIGAEVELFARGQVQRRQVMPTRSYLSQVELPVTFGLGDAGIIEKIVIRWPDGTVQQLNEFAVDKQTTIEQPE